MDLGVATQGGAALVGDRALALIAVSGQLLRDGGGFVLRADDGRLLRLTLPRTPVDLVEKRVRIVGHAGQDDELDVEGIGPDR